MVGTLSQSDCSSVSLQGVHRGVHRVASRGAHRGASRGVHRGLLSLTTIDLVGDNREFEV